MVSYQKNGRNKWYPTETISDAGYADDLALLANESAEAKSLLHSLKQAARGIVLYVNSNKTELKYFKQNGFISLFNDKPLKLVD